MSDRFEMLVGDALEVLRAMPDQSVHLVVTSPPYYGLRDYGTGAWEGGNDPACKHKEKPARKDEGREISSSPGHPTGSIGGGDLLFKRVCRNCGATRVDRQMGTEPVHDCFGWATGRPCRLCYLCRMLEVFDEVRRVLRDDGSLWVNLGDSYATGAGKVGDSPGGGEQGDRWKGAKPRASFDGKHAYTGPVGPQTPANRMPLPGLKPKDLILMPARFALAMQRRGWWVRRDVIWHKEQAMPESAADRPTTAHEYVYLFTKSRLYFYDRLAAMEPVSGGTKPRDNGSAGRGPVTPKGEIADERDTRANSRFHAATTGLVTHRNRRSVWSLGSMATSEPHFATYPIEVPELCILLGTSEHGVCPRCGAPWRRVLRKTLTGDWHPDQALKKAGVHKNAAKFDTADRTIMGKRMKENTAAARAAGGAHDNPFATPETTGWRPTCNCSDPRFRKDDFEIIHSPTGAIAGPDPTLEVGRAGYSRPRRANEGSRPITRYEQRRYAAQLRESEHRNEMEAEAGEAFKHYVRTDKTGARPIPAELLDKWIAAGWIHRVEAPVPCRSKEGLKPATVLDPFAGLGTTGLAALKTGRRFIGIDLSERYCRAAVARARKIYALMMNAPIEPKFKRKKKETGPTFQATFRQPAGELNPIGALVPTPIDVEVFPISRTYWGARERSSGTAYKVRAVSAAAAQAAIAAMFEMQLKPWVEHLAIAD